MKSTIPAALLLVASTTFRVHAPAPRQWIDPDTGHRIVRLTDDAGGTTLYFHDNAFSAMSKHHYVTGRGGVEPNVHITPDKKWVIFTGQFAAGDRHVYAVEIATAQSREKGEGKGDN